MSRYEENRAMTLRSTIKTGQASSCYFRTTTSDGARKALVQIDERCNLHCAHCFVSATRVGQSMRYGDIIGLLIPRLKECRVERVTLTGGEPTIHPRFTDIVRSLRDAGMQVGFCTNATTLTDAQIHELASIGGVHANVSLDGFRAGSHGRFRGNRDSFAVTIATVRRLAAARLLQGLLCTPNSLAEDEEYRELCEFAAENSASMGRGVKSRGRLADNEDHMRRIKALTAPFDGQDLEVVHIRFPSTDGQPLAGCEAGTIIYVFTGGQVTVCPYLVFAARAPQSRHDPSEFIVGNIFTDTDIAERLDAYRFSDRYQMGVNPTCRSCGIAGHCGKGCPAAVIAAGEQIGALDAEVCPVTSGERRMLPLMTA
jgi:radical SAM protein with 4Fe4S-binding SPASM domain